MPRPKPGQTMPQFTIETAYRLGYLWHIPQNKLHLLSPSDPDVVQAMIAMSRMDSIRYTQHVLQKHGRAPDFDGVIGPAMEAMVLEEGRCPVPDIAPPPGVVFAFDSPDLQEICLKMQRDAQQAIGTGNWPGCNSVGNFHCAAIGINNSNLPAFLQSLFFQVLTNVRKAYAGVGLLLKFIQNGRDVLTGVSFTGNINSDLSFVTSSDGWIGLAIVGQNESCSSRIWCKFLNTYKGGSTDEVIVQQWTTLIKHEIGHNCGRSHTSGGVMNPSIVNGLPTEWTASDPSTSWLKGQFGGIPVPIPGDTPIPPGPPNPPADIEKRIHKLEVDFAVHKAVTEFKISGLEARVKKLEGG